MDNNSETATIELPHRSKRSVEVGKRITHALEQVNKVKTIKHSHLAEAIGMTLVAPVESWITGAEEAPLPQLDKISAFLGINAAWLKHGDGKLFPCDYIRLTHDPVLNISWLINTKKNDNFPDLVPSLEKLIFLRADSNSGELAIVKQLNSFHCVTYITPTNVSNQIGTGGERQLMDLFVTLELLYKIYGKTTSINVCSAIVKDEKFTEVINGDINPLALVSNHPHGKTWWEDIWEEEQCQSDDAYWSGFNNLRVRILASIETDTYLKEQKQRIQNDFYSLYKEIGITDA